MECNQLYAYYGKVIKIYQADILEKDGGGGYIHYYLNSKTVTLGSLNKPKKGKQHKTTDSP